MYRVLVKLSSRPWLIQADVRVAFFRLNLDRQVDAWQLILVNINRWRSLDISTVKETLLGLAHARTHSPAIVSIQETKTLDVLNLELPGIVCYGSESGFATLLVSERFCKWRDHRSLKRDVQQFSLAPPW